MEKYGQEEASEEILTPEVPTPDASVETGEPETNGWESGEEEAERLLKSSLILIESGLREAASKGFLGAGKAGFAENALGWLNSALSGALPGGGPLAGRIKSKKNILKEYNSEYNKKAKEEFGVIVRDIALISQRNFGALIKLIEENVPKESRFVSGISPKEISEYADMLNASNEKTSQLLPSSPSNIILNKIIPIITYLFKDIQKKYLLFKDSRLDDDKISLYQAIKTLIFFNSNFEMYAVEEAIKKTKRTKIEQPESAAVKSDAEKPKPEESTEAPAGASEISDLKIIDIIPLDGFTLASKLDRTGSSRTIQIEDPLSGDVSFGIKFNKKTLPYEPKALARFAFEHGKAEGYDIEEDTGVTVNISKYDGSEVLIIKIERAAIEKARDFQLETIFSLKLDTGKRKSVLAEEDNSSIKKLSAAGGTTPLYETVSPSGEKISFTPADLVAGTGRLKDSKGKSFKPKKIKGKSLAERVMSKQFGKTRK
jgi:hypothetical protein